jgi:hypothetical protein
MQVRLGLAAGYGAGGCGQRASVYNSGLAIEHPLSMIMGQRITE